MKVVRKNGKITEGIGDGSDFLLKFCTCDTLLQFSLQFFFLVNATAHAEYLSAEGAEGSPCLDKSFRQDAEYR